jgi:hypothetical protein
MGFVPSFDARAESFTPELLSPSSWMEHHPASTETDVALREEAALMRAFLERDPEAARQLYRHVAPAIYGLGSLLLRDAAKAADLVEATIVRAWRLGGTFDPYAIRLHAWVRSIARDIAVAVLSGVSPDRELGDFSDVLRGAIASGTSPRFDNARIPGFLASAD